MKRFDDSTKKLIKNVAALITSALVLIAATVAWFASGSKSDVNQIGASFKNENYSVTNYEMTDTAMSGILESVTVGGSSPGFSFNYGAGNALTLAEKMDPDIWLETNDFNITSLEPGFFKSFKISVTSSISMFPTLKVDSISTPSGVTLSEADKETVLRNIYVHAVVVQTTTTTQIVNEEETTQTTYTVEGDYCGSLYDMYNPATGKISQQLCDQITGSYDVLLDIGVPGASVTTVTLDANQNETSTTDNLRNAHDALRQIGTSITLSPVSVGR